MSNLWQRIRCRFFQAHRWVKKEIDYETAFECRVCRKRYFPAQPPGWVWQAGGGVGVGDGGLAGHGGGFGGHGGGFGGHGGGGGHGGH
jgi:hypothetical protein